MIFRGTSALRSSSKGRLCKELCNFLPSSSLCKAARSLKQKSDFFLKGASAWIHATRENSSPQNFKLIVLCIISESDFCLEGCKRLDTRYTRK